MNRLLTATLFLAVTLSGCCLTSPDKIDLDKKWLPLTTLAKSPERPKGVYWTRCPTTYTSDICDFLNRSSVEQGGLLVHEQTHAIRQQATAGGWAAYEAHYSSDPNFLVSEELLAYSNEIAYAVRNGGKVDPEYMANFMSTYYVLNGKHLFDHDWVVKWVNDQIAKAKARN
jgi:hypothetical protein